MKVLVIRFSSIGDIVLTSPVMRCLKKQLPDCEVHYLTKAAYAPLVAHSPYVDQLHVLHDRLGPVVRELRKQRFDLVIDLHHNARTLRVKAALGVPSRSFAKLNREKWMLVNLKMDRLPRIHIVDRYMQTVAHLGITNDGQGLDLFIPPENEVDLEQLPRHFRNGYTAFCIGAGHMTKRLPVHKMVELAQKLSGPVLIVGAREDQEAAAAICTAIGGRAFDATGKYDLLSSASLIRQARSVVAHDSGAMHIACAFQRPVVSVWGNTVPAFGMGPYMPQHPGRAHISEVTGLDCRPCSKIGFDRCPLGHFHCMEWQDTAQIAEWARAGDGAGARSGEDRA